MSVINSTDAALQSAAAIARLLPGELAPGTPADGAAALETAIPGEGAKAVTANLAGDVTGSIVIIVNAEVAAALENGPVGPQELAAALEPALTDGAAALAAQFGSVRHEAALALDPAAAIGSTAGHGTITVVPMLIGGAEHAASLVLMMTQPGAADSDDLPEPTSAAAFENLSSTLGASTGGARAVELLNDVEMGLTAELGRTRMTVRELLSMQPGSIVELDRAAGSPVDLLVNGTLVARGEVVVIDEEFGVRITEIIGYDQKKNG
jgi:flagellar motor switch protein FliN/FliY